MGSQATRLVEEGAGDLNLLRGFICKTIVELPDQTTDHKGRSVSAAADPYQQLGQPAGISFG
jgi:hypothetical protein